VYLITRLVLVRVAPVQMWPEPDLGTESGQRFGENLFSDRGTIRLMKLMASTMLSATLKRQYSSVLPLLHQCLPVFKNLWNGKGLYIFCPGNTN